MPDSAPLSATSDAPAPDPPAASEARPRLPFWLALVTLLGAYLRFGYVYGAGDQDELIPSVLHLLNASLFTQDWLVQTITAGVNVRSAFLWLTALPSLVMPVWAASALLWAGTVIALAYGVYGLAWEVLRDRLAAALAVPLALVITVKWTLGANALVSNAHVPESVAWALAIPAITLFLRRRWITAGALLGVAAWFHLLAGAQTALVLAAAGLIRAALTTDLDARRLRTDVRGLTRFAVACLGAALPVLIPVALGQLDSALPMERSVSPFYIHAQFRNPFHHLASTFGAAAHLRFWPTIVLGVAAGWWLRRRGLRHGLLLAAAGCVIVLLCTASVVFVEFVPITFVAKLQFFKLTVLATLGASVLLAGAAAAVLPDRLRRFAHTSLDARRIGAAAAVVALVLVAMLAVRDVGRPGALLYPLRHTATPLGAVERWARAETPRDALWSVPPSVSSFRSFARRAVAANYAGFVFRDRDMQRWFFRLMDFAPIAPPPNGIGIKPVLDTAYHDLDAETWRRLRSSYGVDYVLVDRDEAHLPFEVVYANEAWMVYRLPVPDAEAAP